MKPKPIIFSSPMVRAIRADQKTSTCRISDGDTPRYQKGDILYVRESVAASGMDDKNRPLADPPIIYKADFKEPLPKPRDIGPYLGWKPAIHMFEWMARIYLEITNVVPIHIMSLNANDILKEGITMDFGRELTTFKAWVLSGKPPECKTSLTEFSNLFNQVNNDPIPHNALKDKTFCWYLSYLCYHAQTFSFVGEIRQLVFRTLWNTLNAKPKPKRTKGKISHYESHPYRFKDRHQSTTINGKPHTATPNPLVHMYEFQRIEKPA